MSKGKRYDPQDKRDAVASFNGMGGTTEAAKEVAADYGVHYTTIRDWAKANEQVKKNSEVIRSVRAKIAENARSKPAKRKTSKRSVKATKPDKMAQLKAEYQKLTARQKEIKSEMTKLFFERILEEE